MMLIRSGIAQVVAVEAHSKVSDVRSLGAIEAFALDPVFNRPLGIGTLSVAALEMNAFLERTRPERGTLRGGRREEPDERARQSARRVRRGRLDRGRRRLDAAVVAAASARGRRTGRRLRRDRARGRGASPRPDRGAGLGPRRRVVLRFARRSRAARGARRDATTRAAAMAYRHAGITDASEEIDLLEVDDTYAFRELEALEALGLRRGGRPRDDCSTTASWTPTANSR